MRIEFNAWEEKQGRDTLYDDETSITMSNTNRCDMVYIEHNGKKLKLMKKDLRKALDLFE